MLFKASIWGGVFFSIIKLPLLCEVYYHQNFKTICIHPNLTQLHACILASCPLTLHPFCSNHHSLLSLAASSCASAVLIFCLCQSSSFNNPSLTILKLVVISAFRKLIKVTTIFSRGLFFFGSFMWVRQVGSPAPVSEAPIWIIAPHASFTDVILLAMFSYPSIICKVQLTQLHFFGSMSC